MKGFGSWTSLVRVVIARLQGYLGLVQFGMLASGWLVGGKILVFPEVSPWLFFPVSAALLLALGAGLLWFDMKYVWVQENTLASTKTGYTYVWASVHGLSLKQLRETMAPEEWAEYQTWVSKHLANTDPSYCERVKQIAGWETVDERGPA